MRAFAVSVIVAAAAAAAFAFACSSKDEGCKPGEVQACTCADGSQGTSACGAGHVTTPCKCGGVEPNVDPNQPPGPPRADAGVDSAPPEQNPARPRGPSGMVSVAAGKAKMGCAGGLDLGCRDDSHPVHDVTLTAFTLMKTEVTQGEYQKCVGAGACKAPASRPECAIDPAGRADFSVVCVTWDDAKAYCASQGMRLPTEAEWERAARGTLDDTLYPWGLTPPPDCDHANFFGVRGCKLRVSDVVGLRESGASPVGALDLAGNVWEWVEDVYGAGYYASSPPSDPKGPSGGGAHVIRGGSFGSGTASLQTTYREQSSGENEQIGFRCAK